MCYDNTRTRATGSVMGSATEKTDPFEIFSEFFKQQNGADLNEEQITYMKKILDELKEEEK
jgi:exonuclease SbcD